MKSWVTRVVIKGTPVMFYREVDSRGFLDEGVFLEESAGNGPLREPLHFALFQVMVDNPETYWVLEGAPEIEEEFFKLVSVKREILIIAKLLGMDVKGIDYE